MEPIAPQPTMFLLPAGTLVMMKALTEVPFEIPSDPAVAVYAADQPQYEPLPSMKTRDGKVISQWKPTADELRALNEGQPITMVNYTFNQPLQPVVLTVGGIDAR